MTARYLQMAFTPAVKSLQREYGSRDAYARLESGFAQADRLGLGEMEFVAARDSFYMATVSEAGWPYIQHRGGPPGFVKVLDERTLGFADYRGNRQFVSLGNLQHDARASLFFMDYARQARLKLFARISPVDLGDRPELASALVDSRYNAKVERGLLINVESFDWNCSQHIAPRISLHEFAPVVEDLQSRIAELQAEIERLNSAG